MGGNKQNRPNSAKSSAMADNRQLQVRRLSAAVAAIGVSLGMYPVFAEAAFDAYLGHQTAPQVQPGPIPSATVNAPDARPVTSPAQGAAPTGPGHAVGEATYVKSISWGTTKNAIMKKIDVPPAALGYDSHRSGGTTNTMKVDHQTANAVGRSPKTGTNGVSLNFGKRAKGGPGDRPESGDPHE